ncbi:hypothetical protein H6G00_32195 [Leptolyngbya sp. FACHB-541]|uniref:hypothetical protein n=1 Tax=Leptolyngbya sp. FACHB-541 TaxID=2692810 RepID=UPI0016870BF0|nr:hypothetical protein [Leptolyngbya sp. FACHB-541]MBD2001203.1 hypothetical protein [Leptolyngbya sp. FACHB-541]
MTQPNLHLAKQGNEQAIATFIEKALRTEAIATKVSLTDGCLRIMLEAAEIPDQTTCLKQIYRALLHLQIPLVKSVQVYACQQDQLPVWADQCSANRLGLLKGLAKQGDEEAIAVLLSRALAHQTVEIKAQLQNAHLSVYLSSDQTPNQRAAVTLVERELAGFSTNLIADVQVFGKRTESDSPGWTEEFSRQVPTEGVVNPPTTEAIPVSNLLKSRAGQPLSAQQPAQPPMEWTFKFNYLKLGFVSALAFHGLFSASDYTVDGFLIANNGIMMFLHGVNLIFHEAGHVLFSPFGRFIYVLGGSLMQILVPAGICGYFFYTQQRYASAIALCWAGENFWDVSIYIKDAQDRILPLLGGEISYHDWHYLLLHTSSLAKAQPFGNFVYTIGTLIYAFAVFAGVYYAQIDQKAETASEK